MAKIVVDTEEFYSVEEAAEELSKGVATIWRRIKDKSILTLKIGGRTLIPKTEVERIQKENNGEKA